MKSETKIRERLYHYKNNLSSIKNEEGKMRVKGMMEELKWVLKNDWEE